MKNCLKTALIFTRLRLRHVIKLFIHLQNLFKVFVWSIVQKFKRISLRKMVIHTNFNIQKIKVPSQPMNQNMLNKKKGGRYVSIIPEARQYYDKADIHHQFQSFKMCNGKLKSVKNIKRKLGVWNTPSALIQYFFFCELFTIIKVFTNFVKIKNLQKILIHQSSKQLLLIPEQENLMIIVILDLAGSIQNNVISCSETIQLYIKNV